MISCYVDIPLVEVCLAEDQLLHACAAHYEEHGSMYFQLEVIGTKHPCYGKCKQAYYCDQEVSRLFDCYLIFIVTHKL